MRFEFCAALSALALAIATPTSAEPLFQQFEVGASEPSVLARYPNAALDKANSSETVRAFRLEAFPEPGMWTYFTFADGLRMVKVYGRGAAHYLKVVDALQVKYGRPTSRSDVGSSGITTWRRASTSITAELTRDIDMGVGFVAHEPFTVTYEPIGSNILEQGL